MNSLLLLVLLLVISPSTILCEEYEVVVTTVNNSTEYEVAMNDTSSSSEYEYEGRNPSTRPDWPDVGSQGIEDYLSTLRQEQQNGDKANMQFSGIIQPISFIVFVKSDGITGRIPYQDMLNQIDQLNQAYSGQEAVQAGYPQAMDTKIRFKLAGIRYVISDDLFKYCALSNYIDWYKPKYMMDGARHLNVYSCDIHDSLGLSWLPYGEFFFWNIKSLSHGLTFKQMLGFVNQQRKLIMH
jgi:hypothetical protein